MADIITIDGPTSSGKNSVGFLLAKRLSYRYIDTGMIYRVGTYLALQENISFSDTQKIAGIFKELNIDIKTDREGLRIFNNGEDLTGILHSPLVTKNVSIVAAMREVREATKSIQYQLGQAGNTVMTGRDIGSEIFPSARNKFYLTASVEVRAKRRFKQLIEKDPKVKYEDVLTAMKERDQQDKTREVSPLRIPENAIVIDNSNLSIEETVEEMLKKIHV